MEVDIDGLKFKLNNDEKSASLIKSMRNERDIAIPPLIEYNGKRYMITTIEKSVFVNGTEKITLPDKSIDDILMNQIRLLEKQLGQYRYLEPFSLEAQRETPVHENFIEEMKILYDLLLTFIEDESNENDDDNFQNLNNYINQRKIVENQKKFNELLLLISQISMNHQRSPNFMPRIENLLMKYKLKIKQTFSISSLYNLFIDNKHILRFFLEKKIIPSGKYLLEAVDNISDKNGTQYSLFFYPELKQSLSSYEKKSIEEQITNIDPEALDNFVEKRRKGENTSHLCKLIREDLIDEFVVFHHQTNLVLSKSIEPSIFETNRFLLKRNPTIIEYAAFFGSIQIFKYLKLNGVELSQSLWLYAIHSKSAEMIHLLEESYVNPEDETFDECLKESIKCHHNSIASYIQENLLNEEVESENIKNNFNKNVVLYAFHYYNFSYFPNNFNNSFIFHYACKYGHILFVDYLLNIRDIDLNETVIFKLINIIKLQNN